MSDQIIELLKSEQYWLAAVITVLAILINIEKIFSIVDLRKKKKISLLNEAIASSSIEEKLKNHLKDEIENEYFYLTHKIRMDKFKRNLLLEFHSEKKGDVTLNQLKRANDFLVIKNEKLQIEITKFEYLSFYYNITFGILMAIFGFVLLVVPSLAELNIYKIFGWLGLCSFLITLGFFMVYQTFPFILAKRIRTLVNAI